MPEPKFAPGPWVFGRRDDGSIWLSCGDPARGQHEQFDLGENEATARLIAAAPELYRALDALLHWFENNPTGIGALAASNHARNILTKARGDV
jgi:hypothetical protein